MPAPKLATVENLKVPPHSLEAKQAVLGGLLLSSRAWDTVADIITEKDFYREDHRLIFRAVAELSDGGKPCDAVTVTEWFESRGQVDQVDGGAYISQLASSTPSAANVKAYAEIVREKSILRQLIDVGAEITSGAFSLEGKDSRELLEEAERKVFAIADQGQRSGSSYISVQETIKEAIEKIQELHEFEGEITGTPTGFKDFDKLTAGLQDSDLIIVAGRPSMGKTTLAMNIAENAAIKHEKPVAIFSMEMSAQQLVRRMFSSLGQIDQNKLRSGNLDDLDFAQDLLEAFDAQWLLPELTGLEMALLATMLAPTDAALGKAVVTNETVPNAIRQGLNVESGLNDGICVPILFVFLALATGQAGEEGPWRLAMMLVAEEIGIGLAVGLLVSIFQAATSINEMTLVFIPKMLAVAVALIFFFPWMMQTMVVFTRNLFLNIMLYVR